MKKIKRYQVSKKLKNHVFWPKSPLKTLTSIVFWKKWLLKTLTSMVIFREPLKSRFLGIPSWLRYGLKKPKAIAYSCHHELINHSFLTKLREKSTENTRTKVRSDMESRLKWINQMRFRKKKTWWARRRKLKKGKK